ncbi:MAG TPA: COX15/CtaA family protein [Ktedonobacterales bacterium]
MQLPQTGLAHTLASGGDRARHLLGRIITRQVVKWLSVATSISMFIVLITGTLVTTTNSAQGCGPSWPLCRGQFIPQFAVSTAIEFLHRVSVTPATLLILLLTVGVLVYWRDRLEIRILAPLMVLFLFAQAALGALAVMYPQTPAVLALHFGVSLISFASVLLTTIFLYEQGAWEKLRDRPVPRGFTALVWGLAVYTYIVVYLGAFVRHNHVELACQSWPLCANGSNANAVFPGFTGAVGIVFTHRVAALILTFGTLWLFVWARRMRVARPDLYWGSLAALIFLLLQALDGAFVVYSRLDIFSTLSHSGFVALLFGAMCYLCMHVLPRPRAARAADKARTSGNAKGASVINSTSSHIASSSR